MICKMYFHMLSKNNLNKYPMKKLLFYCFILFFSFTTNISKAQTEVTFYTSMGSFVARMYDTLQPITAGNFITLVNAKFYDGIIFHRVVPNFVIQGGDPTGTGNGGPGYTILDEFDPLASNVQQALGMANSGPNTGGSQFYINLVNNVFLDPNYPVFGIVISNFSVVQAIGQVATNSADRPLTDVVMDSVRVTLAGPLGMHEAILPAFQVDIFPNPIVDKMNIDFGQQFSKENEYKIKISNVLGDIVYTNLLDQKVTSIDISTWGHQGIYFVQIIDKHNNVLNKKISL